MVQTISHKGAFTCNDAMIITDFETGEIICQKCGKVLEEKTADMRKGRSFQDKDTSHEYGTSITMYDMGLSTKIGDTNADFIGRRLSFEMRQTMKRMRLWDSRSKVRTTSQKNMRSTLIEMNKIKEKLGLSDAIMERAAYIYRKAVKIDLARGRSLHAILGACLYAACRDMGTTRTIRDISKEVQEKPKIIAKCYRLLFQNLKLTIPIPNIVSTITKIANNLDVSEATKREAIMFYDILREKELTAGKNPHAVAASVIYMAGIKTGANLTQGEITEVTGITGVTIRNRIQEYRKHIKLI